MHCVELPLRPAPLVKLLLITNQNRFPKHSLASVQQHSMRQEMHGALTACTPEAAHLGHGTWDPTELFE